MLRLAAMPDIEEIVLLPLYPHYAMSSVKTCLIEAERIKQSHNLSQTLTIHPVFYRHPDYISDLVASADSLTLMSSKPDSGITCCSATTAFPYAMLKR